MISCTQTYERRTHTVARTQSNAPAEVPINCVACSSEAYLSASEIAYAQSMRRLVNKLNHTARSTWSNFSYCRSPHMRCRSAQYPCVCTRGFYSFYFLFRCKFSHIRALRWKFGSQSHQVYDYICNKLYFESNRPSLCYCVCIET